MTDPTHSQTHRLAPQTGRLAPQTRRLAPLARQLLLAGTLALLAACAQTVSAPPGPDETAAAQLTLRNLSGVPGAERLVFSRIGSLAAPPADAVRAVVSLRLENTGSAPLSVTALPISGPWTLGAGVTLPFELAAGAVRDVPVTFTAAFGLSSPPQLVNGTLEVRSSAPGTPQTVTLSGLWQAYPERDPSGATTEPSLDLIRQAFGLTTLLSTAADAAALTGRQDGSSTPLNQRGLVRAQGDEVLSAYWQPADPASPVQVEQLAAYEKQGESTTLSWAPQGGSALTPILSHAGTDSQTVLPRLAGGAQGFAAGSFSAGGPFAFYAAGISTEWSDPARNNQTTDRKNGCPGPCGQHLRFWPVKTAAGPVANTYLLAIDYASLNNDYQDDVYLVRNVRPAGP